MRRWAASFLGLALLAAGRGDACTLCLNVQQSQTFRQEAAGASAKIIVYGHLANPQLKANGSGTTELVLREIVRDDPFLAGRKTIEIPRFLPISDPKNPPRFLVFCDVYMNKLDPYRGVPIKDESTVAYLKRALALKARDPVEHLLFFFNYLDHPDPEVSRDAFLEFAKANDADVGRVAPRLSPAKLRTWIDDPQTPPERLGLYAYLLGGCGGEAEATYLHRLLAEPSERTANAFDGILSGYIHLRPREGWALALATLSDGKKPLTIRLAVMRTIRFYLALPGKEQRPFILKALAATLAQGELADLAIEELRKARITELTRAVLACYGQKGYDAPIVQRAIVRYALTSNDEPSRQFLAELRKQDADLVKEVEESLQFERRE